jgi:chitin synthase
MSKVQYNSSDVPVPTIRAPNLSGATVRRAKTLTRPERSVAPVPLIKPAQGLAATAPDASGFDAWTLFSRVITFWAPGFLLSSVGGMHDKNTIQAWREKMSLCFIAIVMGGIVGFATVGLQKTLCPQTSASTSSTFIRYGSVQGTIGIQGYLFNASDSTNTDILKYAKQAPGQDITALFQRSASNYPACNGLKFRIALDDPCATGNCTLGALNSSSTFSGLGITNTSALVGYDWDNVAALDNYFVIDGAVLDMNPYFNLHPNTVPTDTVDAALRSVMAQTSSGGKDGTKLFTNRADLKSAIPCLTQRYYAGNIDKITPGCFISQLFLYLSLTVILSLVLIRFAMACVFSWFLSKRLTGSPSSSELNRPAISPAVMPAGANVSIDSQHGTAPWSGQDGNIKKLTKTGKSSRSLAASSTGTDTPAPVMSLAQIGAELFAVCLVTCYSEGEDSLRTTLDSISLTDYSDHRKLLFVVADGMITGAGEKKSTPDICVSLLDADPRFGNPQPMSYFAVGSGAKQENRAMVYAG